MYPTVSDQKRLNATKAKDPEQRDIARFQAARFGQHCRVYAPVYRQLTLQGIGATTKPADGVEGAKIAYSDVEAALKDYLKRYNRGRGVVLVGHSQGAGMLSQLVRKQIDTEPSVRRRLVAAYLLGGNVTVKKGSDRGGSFRNVRACRSATQTGCVVAFSTYNQTPPANSLFGRTGGRFATVFGQGNGSDLEVLCNNPGALRGGAAKLTSVLPSRAVPHHHDDRLGQQPGGLHRALAGHDLRGVPKRVLGPLLVGGRGADAPADLARGRTGAQAGAGRHLGPAPAGRQCGAGRPGRAFGASGEGARRAPLSFRRGWAFVRGKAAGSGRPPLAVRERAHSWPPARGNAGRRRA